MNENRKIENLENLENLENIPLSILNISPVLTDGDTFATKLCASSNWDIWLQGYNECANVSKFEETSFL